MYSRILAWLLCAFFCFGAWSNANPPEWVISNYSRWGYPDWFHYLTAAMELMVALLLIADRTRLPGAIAGILVMFAAAATVAVHDGIRQAALPAFILVLLAIIALQSKRPFKLTNVRTGV